ncbi:hypothetical protein EON66_10590 [archaeon]|nr:MAG: hypothetical protein EON66_10590 [archaeon]
MQEGEEGKEAPPKFSEAHRLAYIVAAIEYDCGLVPKGAFKATPIRQITPDPSFTGLSHTDASSLANYLHFRAATSEVRKAALHRVRAMNCVLSTTLRIPVCSRIMRRRATKRHPA